MGFWTLEGHFFTKNSAVWNFPAIKMILVAINRKMLPVCCNFLSKSAWRISKGRIFALRSYLQMENKTSLTLLEWISPCLVFRLQSNVFWRFPWKNKLIFVTELKSPPSINKPWLSTKLSTLHNKQKNFSTTVSAAKMLQRQGSTANFRNNAQILGKVFSRHIKYRGAKRFNNLPNFIFVFIACCVRTPSPISQLAVTTTPFFPTAKFKYAAHA